MAVIADCSFKTKAKSKGRQNMNGKPQRNNEIPGKPQGPNLSKDVNIVDDLECEINNLSGLAVDKCVSVHHMQGILDNQSGDYKHDELQTKYAEVCSKQYHQYRGSDDLRGRSVLHENVKVNSADVYTQDQSSLLSQVEQTNVTGPIVSPQFNDCAFLPGQIEEPQNEELTTTAQPKRNGTLILSNPVLSTSHPYEEQNGSITDLLSMKREFSNHSLISDRTSGSRMPNSITKTPDKEKTQNAVKGANESLIKSAIPNLLPGQAVVCLVLNILIPGTGTILSGFFILCGGKSRMSSKHGNATVMTIFVNMCVGVSQMFTVALLLVGWIWSITWGVNMVAQSAEWRRKRKLQRVKQLQSFALNALNKNASDRIS